MERGRVRDGSRTTGLSQSPTRQAAQLPTSQRPSRVNLACISQAALRVLPGECPRTAVVNQDMRFMGPEANPAAIGADSRSVHAHARFQVVRVVGAVGREQPASGVLGHAVAGELCLCDCTPIRARGDSLRPPVEGKPFGIAHRDAVALEFTGQRKEPSKLFEYRSALSIECEGDGPTTASLYDCQFPQAGQIDKRNLSPCGMTASRPPGG